MWQVASLNRFDPPSVVVAAQDHRVNITQSVHKPARLRFRWVQWDPHFLTSVLL